MSNETAPNPLRAARHRQGLSLRETAAMADLSIGYVSKVERGIKQPSLTTLRRLAPVLGLGPADLVGILHVASGPTVKQAKGDALAETA